MEHRPLMGMLRAEEIEPQRSPGVDALEDRGEQLLFGGEMHAQLVGEGIDDANQLGMMREELAVAAGETFAAASPTSTIDSRSCLCCASSIALRSRCLMGQSAAGSAPAITGRTR